MLSLRRPALLAAAVIGLLAAPSPLPASADTARLDPPAAQIYEKTKSFRIVVTTVGGQRRTLGPYRSPGSLRGVLAAPDGRHIALLPEDDEASQIPIAPLDGSPLRLIRLPPGFKNPDFSQFSWTPDGTELLIGDAWWTDPALPAPEDNAEMWARSRWSALRCSVAATTCTEVAGPGGLAVGVPGRVLTTSSVLSTFPTPWLFEGFDEIPRPDWERPASKRGRMWAGVSNDARVVQTQFDGPDPVLVDRVSRPASGGLPTAVVAVGGPAGALVLRGTVVLTLEHRKGRVRLMDHIRPTRFVIVRPDGRLDSFSNRPMTLPANDLRRIAESVSNPRRRLFFHPEFGTANGWLGSGVADPTGGDSAVLATMGVEGRSQPVTVGGRTATPRALLHAAYGRAPGRVSGPLRIVGYEAPGKAIVTVPFTLNRKHSGQRSVTLRVPLDGIGRPTIVRGGADTAW